MLHQNIVQIEKYFLSLQEDICKNLEKFESNTKKFKTDNWQSDYITGKSNTISDGTCIEKGGVNFSKVIGTKLPSAATEKRPDLVGHKFTAVGISLVIHPFNPFIPTTHMNLRLFFAEKEHSKPIWWFGGGYDLTPFYPFIEDCVHWHTVAKQACDKFGINIYSEYKKLCDEYFYIKHRDENRGIGGLFFDDLNEKSKNNNWDFHKCFNFIQSIGNSFLQAYIPIIKRRINIKYTERERNFQLYRRGRYVEFNLIYDRGTLFGLQMPSSRTESILMSLPPHVRWEYNWQPEIGSKEYDLHKNYLKPKDWI